MNKRYENERWGRLLRETVAVISKPKPERSSFLRFIVEADNIYKRFLEEFQNNGQLEKQFVQLLMTKFEGPTADSVAMSLPDTYNDFKRAMIKAGSWVRHHSVIENEARTTRQLKTETALGYIGRLEVLRNEYATALNMDKNQTAREKTQAGTIFEKAIVDHAIRSLSDRLLRHIFSHQHSIETLHQLRQGIEEEMDRNVDDTNYALPESAARPAFRTGGSTSGEPKDESEEWITAAMAAKITELAKLSRNLADQNASQQAMEQKAFFTNYEPNQHHSWDHSANRQQGNGQENFQYNQEDPWQTSDFTGQYPSNGWNEEDYHQPPWDTSEEFNFDLEQQCVDEYEWQQRAQEANGVPYWSTAQSQQAQTPTPHFTPQNLKN